VKRALRNSGIALGCLIALLALVGSGYEHVARRRIEAAYPATGRMIDVGGRGLQLDCRGRGSPAVVFESGRDLYGALSWYRVQDEVASFTRACSYSRAGILWSDPTHGPHTGEAEADDLHAALQKAGEAPPLVLVGQSAGGINILIYTQKFGAQVAGLVFVDASHPEQFPRLKSAIGMEAPSPNLAMKAMKSLEWTGLPRLVVPEPDPGAPLAMRTISAYTPTSMVAAINEMEADTETFAAARGAKATVGDRPLYVLTAGQPPPGVPNGFEKVWRELQDDEASWSSQSEHQIVLDSHHDIQFEQPQRVVGAVRWTVDRVRQTSAK
jgi:pimeloyl-ACP methyl ester carboxylesterase